MTRHVATLAVLTVLCSVNAPAIAIADEVLVAMNTVGQTAPGQTRAGFVRGLTNQVLGIVHHSGTPLAVKKQQLEATFMQVVDLRWIAQFVVGKPWDTATAQQRDQYVGLYGKYLSSMYLAGLDEKSEENLRDITVLGMDDAFEDAFMVHTQMVMVQGNNIAVDYMVREEAGQRKVVDIVLEGVSMLKSHRSELGAVASAKGMDGLIAALQDKMNRGETHLASAH